MDFLEGAKAHFRAQVDGELKVIDVPEWGEAGKPLRVYYGPQTLKQRDKVYKFIIKDTLEMYVETLIQRAKTQDGKPMFRSVNRTELMTMVDPKVLIRIADAMSADNEFDADETLEKNS